MEDYVTFEQAQRVKELGFDWKCNHYYQDNDKSFHQNFYENHSKHSRMRYKEDNTFIKVTLCSAPTLSQAQKWLREVKKEHIIVCLDRWVTNKPYRFDLYQEFGEELYGQCVVNDFQTYEEALSAGISAALKSIENG